MSDKKTYEYEDTPEIEIADNKVGNLLKVIATVLIIICIYYFVEQFFSGSKDDVGTGKDSTPELQQKK